MGNDDINRLPKFSSNVKSFEALKFDPSLRKKVKEVKNISRPFYHKQQPRILYVARFGPVQKKLQVSQFLSFRQ